MTRTRLTAALRIGTAFAALAASAPVLAWQDQDPGQPAGTQVSDEQEAAAANDLDPITGSRISDPEIVVTARRRAESLQDVPIAVTAYSGEALERQGAVDITDISDTTPNVTLETSRGTNTTLTAFIRGVGQQDPVAGYEAGVGLYLDDVFLNRPQAAVLDIYDVERIEVLRGPQGTLYGRNTIGGAIKYVTRRLSEEPSVSARANIGTYQQLDLILSASTPLSDAIRIGGSVARLGRDGFGENLTTGQENYNRDIWAARGTVEIEPTGEFFVRISGDYTKDNSNPRGGHRLIPGLFSGAQPLGDVYDTRGGLVLPEQEIEAYGGAVRAELKVSDAVTLRNIAAYRQDKSATPIDFDALPTIDVDVPAIYRNKQFSNEFQLLYESDQISGLAGFYYLDANANNVFDVILHETGLTLPPALLGPVPFFTASTLGDVDTKTWAAFADFTFDVTEKFAVSLGARYTHDKRSARVFKENLRNGPQVALGGTNPTRYGAIVSNFTGEETFKEVTPRASVTYKPDENNTFYLSYSKGFKGGGFDPRANSPQAGDSDRDGDIDQTDIFEFFKFEPETVDSYEVGYKASLFDRRLRLALAGFWADYKDVQVPGSVGCVVNNVPTFCGVTTNAGAATFKGIETELFANIARFDNGGRVNFTGTMGYLDAQYDEFIANIPAGFSNGGATDQTQPARPVDVADFRRIQNTPKWTLSGTLDFSTPVGAGEVTAATTVSYRSKTFQFETPSPFLDQPGYALWDASLVWSSAGDRFTVGLHAKNILDKQYITSGYQFLNVNPVTGVPILSATRTSPVFNQAGIASSLGREGVATAFYGNPRQVFLSLGVKF
jgi:iron complex outermembrane receptor protein